MAYRFATDKEDYSDLASGQVLVSAPGQPAFPVRLASEIFQRARALLGNPAAVSLYDPCCGSGYHLAVLGFLHREALASLAASDIDPTAAKLATRNLSLLTPEGLNQRRQAIAADWQAFGKASHQAALASADRLMARLAEAPALSTHIFVADATQPGQIAARLAHPIDMVLSDLPYGQLSAWRGEQKNQQPIWHLLEQLRPVLHEQSVVALATTKGKVVAHEKFGRYGRFRHGKRLITFLKPLSD
ncbi:MAG: rRNA methyltransferase [Anaerolineaceae bacterium]|nr:rRNA methyltransferase [Anaerolineaceae bacterium]